MSRSLFGWLSLGILLCIHGALAASTAGMFSDQLNTDLYDCVLSLTPAAKLSSRAAVRLALEAGDNAEIRVTLTAKTLTVETVRRGKATRLGQVVSGVHLGEPYLLTIMRRGTRLGAATGDTVLFHGEVPRAGGNEAGVTAAAGWTVDDARIQRLEPVAFADNFMRTADESGGWVTQSGKWALSSAWDNDPKGNANKFSNVIYAQNAFAWVGQAAKDEQAACTTGKPYWEDYLLTAAVQPSFDGAVGLMANLADPRNGLLARWTPCNDTSSTGNRLALYRVIDGKRTLLAESPGGYAPGQWYKLAIDSSLDGVRVLVDGSERIAVPGVPCRRGGVGLYAEGVDGQVFDDITVYGHTTKIDLLSETRQAHINQRFQEDHNGMQEWAAKQNDWITIPGSYSHMAHTGDFYGDHWIALTVRPSESKTGQIWLVLHGNTTNITSGYRAVLERAEKNDGGKKITCTLYRDTDVLATTKRDMLEVGEDYSLRLRRAGQRIWLELDGETILQAIDAHPPASMRPGFYASGCFAYTRDVVVIGRNVMDYAFSDAPTDWIGDGTWMPTMRWACAPHWSFLGGWSRGDFALWHKQRFSGNHAFQIYVGPKMEYPRETTIYDNHFRDLGITICGDGVNPRSGYTGILGAPGKDGRPNQRTVLLRNGVEVLSTPAFVLPNRGDGHRQWFNLELSRMDNVVELRVEGAVALRYTDPEPLTGGVPAIWSSDNGITVARARLTYADPPQLRNDPRVLLDDPWYPEWANRGQALALDFPHACATTGKPVSLQVATRTAPSGDERAVTVAGTRTTFTPTETGFHWYAVTATDGEHHSPPFHLHLPVFDPARGRDDTHTVLLYRFNERDGSVISDHAAIGPACDLTIPAQAGITRLPGHGLTLHTATPLKSAGTVDKLMAIATHQAGTFEAWVSTDTIYPPSGWIGTLFTWETTTDQQNISFGHQTGSFFTAPRGTGFSQPIKPFTTSGYRTGLLHLVVAWDGKLMTTYINGLRVDVKASDWGVKSWSPDAQLALGALRDGQRNFVGTFYLIALHDACLTADQVARHYQAGPSGE